MSNLTVDMVQAYLYRRCADGVVEYLLLRRSPDEELYPSLWQMVTGHIEQGETAVAAAKREVREETGIVAETLDIVPFVASFYFAADDSIHHVPVFAVEVSADTVIRISSEHAELAWLPYEDAMQTLVFPGHREGLRILRDYMLED